MNRGARPGGRRPRGRARTGTGRCAPQREAVPAGQALAVPALLLLAVPAVLWAGRFHTELKSSDPAADTVLAEPPAAVALTYTTDVQLTLSSVEVRPHGAGRTPLAAGTLAYLADDRHDVLVLPLTGRPGNGTHTVAWATAGPDGHPISGTFDFTVDSPDAAADEGVAAEATPSAQDREDAGNDAQDAGSDAQRGGRALPDRFERVETLQRFVLYAGIVAVLGALVFQLLVLGRCAGSGEAEEVTGFATRRAFDVAALGAGLLAVLLPSRVLLQAAAFFPDDPLGNLGAVVTGTPWAAGWWLQLTGAVLVAGGLALAGRDRARPTGWRVIAAGALLLPLVPLLSGHGWSDGPRALSAAATYLHVMAAGGWMGGLACLLVAGLPALRRHGAGPRAGGPGVAGMVDAFSRVAQGAVALLLVTGGLKVWIHIDSPSDLWTTAWGRTLLIKDLLVAGVLVLGLYNWRVVRPALAGSPDSRRLRRSAVAELLLGAAVVAATSFLVAQPLG